MDVFAGLEYTGAPFHFMDHTHLAALAVIVWSICILPITAGGLRNVTAAIFATGWRRCCWSMKPSGTGGTGR